MNVESVKARLKNLTQKDGGTMQEKLITYALERSIYRLSVSQYVNCFTLKGGIFLYALLDKQFARATMDIDLLAQRIPNDSEEMKKVFQDIFSIEYDDALRYDLDSLDVRNITEFKEYHGVNVSINAYLDRTKVPVSIDIGFGDVVRQNRWKTFVKKKKTIEDVSFEDTIVLVKRLLNPIVEAIRDDSQYDKQWSSEEKQWK